MFCGEAPGKTEEQRGEVFLGKTGEELNRHYLPLANLRRENVCITNAIRCLPISSGGKLDPKRVRDLELLDSCASHHLYPLIERMKPSLIVPLGSFACRAICPGVDLEVQHGFPVETPWGIPAFPSFHPALGLHSPKQMLYIRTDWHRLRKYLNGSLVVPQDAYTEPDYQEVDDVSEMDLDPDLPLACDTESSPDGPFCLTYSQYEGSGRLIRADRSDLLAAFNRHLRYQRRAILFHNWLYDWPQVEAMGLSFPIEKIVDTMVRVYHLGNLPQGLKALAWRELGMEMQDFEDVVRPYSVARVLQYYRQAFAEEWPKPEPQKVRENDGTWKDYKPQSMNTKLKRFFTDYSKNPEGKDPIAMWWNWTEAHEMMEERLGPWHGLDIRDVPFEKTLYYACRDPDAGLRLWNLIRKMPAQVRHRSQEHWVEKARTS